MKRKRLTTKIARRLVDQGVDKPKLVEALVDRLITGATDLEGA